ncbi:MAG: hydrogenase formation protein HypD, partial [Actinobacteria bacterium]|nr:hydrogenase formation protein HypD [Actinomycetota bacterium]
MNIKEICARISSLVRDLDKKSINIMEVCGTHTMEIARNGLKQLLPPEINLISGPGCPVCVTPINEIDNIIEILKDYDVFIFSFGDMIKVPGSSSSLAYEKSIGKDVVICYSPLYALEFAENNPDKNVIFIAIGFETTAPLSSVIVKRASDKKLRNFFIYCTHKIIPPALEVLLKDKEVRIDGLLLPGHVSAIIGSKPYSFVAEDYKIPGVISGFDPVGILQAIKMILIQIAQKKPKIEIEYKSVVKEEGNTVAVKQIHEVFQIQDSMWRGLGSIPKSGLKLKPAFALFDAKLKFPTKKLNSMEPKGCECGNVLKGIKKPDECKFYAKLCTPDNPIGACMVSSEGTCAAYY